MRRVLGFVLVWLVRLCGFAFLEPFCEGFCLGLDLA